MKRTFYLLITVTFAFNACEVEEALEEKAEIKQHTVTVSIEKGLNSKTAIVENEGSVSYTWSEGDEAYFHIYENGVEASSVSMASLSSDKTTATFTATFTDSNASEYTYSAIFAKSFSNNSASVPALQHPGLTSFDPTADLLVSAQDIVSSGQPASSLQFSLARMATVNKMTLKGLTAGETVRTVILSSSNAEFATGSSSLILDYSPLDNAVVGSDGTFDVYIVSSPVTDASFQIYAETDQAIYERNNFSSKLNFSYGTFHSFGLQLGSYRYTGGTVDHPWRLATPDDVKSMSSRLSTSSTTYFKAVADIDLSGVNDWVPLNAADPYDKSINLDGGGHTFSGLNCSYKTYPSFFGVLYGTAKNLTFKDAVISGGETKAGVLAGHLGSGTKQAIVEGITITDSQVSNEDYAGGLAGQIGNATVTDCHVINTTVSSTSERVGGLIGQVPQSYATINCSAENVTVSGDKNVGGLIGVCYGTADNCYSSGTVSASSNTTNYDIAIGGLVGYFQHGTISYCHSSATVSQNNSGRDVGGLVGKMLQGSILQSYATGTVKGSQRNVGGLVGLVSLTAEEATIANSYSTGSVTANSYCGGLVGLHDTGTLTITNCYSSSNISATGGFAAGGLVGFAQAASISMSKSAAWNSTVTPKSYGSGDWSSAAVIGVCHPLCTMTDNYRNPAMSLTAYWVPASDYDHPNVSSEHPLVKQDGTETTATSTASGQVGYPQFPYHGKHTSNSSLSDLAQNTLGWSSSIWSFSGSTPTLLAGSSTGATPVDNDGEEHEWDANRGKVVTPGSDWTSTTIADGITYYKFETTDDISGVRQDVYVTDLDLSKSYKVHFSYSADRATTSEVFSANNAVAAINGTYEITSVFTRINGYNWSVIRNDYIADTSVPNWKSEAAMYIDNDGNIRIGFDGKGKSLSQIRTMYKTSIWPNIFSSAPMLIDDFEPVGESFVDSSLSSAEIEALEYEDPNRHQGVRHPRTAVALTENGHFLMVVVDGRYANYGVGMTAAELTRFLVKHFNPQYALNMDGGGSSTMCISGQGDSSTHVVNYPCDNRGDYGLVHNHDGQRSVPTHIWIGNN